MQRLFLQGQAIPLGWRDQSFTSGWTLSLIQSFALLPLSDVRLLFGYPCFPAFSWN